MWPMRHDWQLSKRLNRTCGGEIRQDAFDLHVRFFYGCFEIVLKKRLCCPRVETAWRTSEPTAAKIMQRTSLQSLKALRSRGLNSRLKMPEVKYSDWHVSCDYLEEINAQRTQIFILQILIL
jgi:hypothetical protein